MLMEVNDKEYKDIISQPLKFYWSDGLTDISISKNFNVIGIVNTPFPTYEISFHDPNGKNVTLGYELPHTNKDWFKEMAFKIGLLIDKENDKDILDYLNKCRDKCYEESERHKIKNKEKCEFHTEQIELG
jgi:hypothetical protein